MTPQLMLLTSDLSVVGCHAPVSTEIVFLRRHNPGRRKRERETERQTEKESNRNDEFNNVDDDNTNDNNKRQ